MLHKLFSWKQTHSFNSNNTSTQKKPVTHQEALINLFKCSYSSV
jgi:hypothetical protein